LFVSKFFKFLKIIFPYAELLILPFFYIKNRLFVSFSLVTYFAMLPSKNKCPAVLIYKKLGEINLNNF